MLNDVYLNHATPHESVVFPGPVKVPSDSLPVIHALLEASQSIPAARRSFSVEGVDGSRWRFQRIRPGLSVARRQPNTIRPLSEIGLPSPLIRHLLSSEMDSGMILVTGTTGTGKTTTASAIVKARLETLGGFAKSLEDPVEQPLEGFHEKGYCIQVDVEDSTYAEKLPESLRAFPSGTRSMFFFGEIRSSEVASELLRFALDGHLIIATLHASSIVAAVERLLAMAQKEGDELGRILLAQAMKMVIHQRLGPSGVSADVLLSDHKTESIIRTGNLEHLKGEVQRTHQDFLRTRPNA